MRLFVSYAREDRPKADDLVWALRSLHHDPWLDEELTGGAKWWDSILSVIRGTDAFVIVLSPALVRSHAASLERGYARTLGKPVLPVMVEAVAPELLPPDLAELHFVDYTAPGTEAAFRLAAAVASLPPAPDPPDPLPAPPPVPVSYLSDLSRRVYAPSLPLDDQLALIGRLRSAWERPSERTAAESLLRALLDRDDLFHPAAREIEKVLATAPPASAPATTAAPATTPAGAAGQAAASVVENGLTHCRIRLRLTQEEHDLQLRWTWNAVLVIDGTKVLSKGSLAKLKGLTVPISDGPRYRTLTMDGPFFGWWSSVREGNVLRLLVDGEEVLSSDMNVRTTEQQGSAAR